MALDGYLEVSDISNEAAAAIVAERGRLSVQISDEEIALLVRLEPYVKFFREKLFRTIDRYWRAASFLTYPHGKETPYETATEAKDAYLSDLRKSFERLSPEELLTFAGAAITEQSLANYTSNIGTAGAVVPLGENGKNEYIISNHQWSGEEGNHDDWFSVIMNQSEAFDDISYGQSKQLLLTDGIDIGTGYNLLKTYVYTSFQELATMVSHKNEGNNLRQKGFPDVTLQALRNIGSDESVHGQFYASIMAQAIKFKPNLVLSAIADMMKHGIVMPASQLREFGQQPGELFEQYAFAAQETEVYTATDYARIWKHLIEVAWRIPGIEDNPEVEEGLSEQGMKDKAFILKRLRQFIRVAEKTDGKMFKRPEALLDGAYPWIRKTA